MGSHVLATRPSSLLPALAAGVALLVGSATSEAQVLSRISGRLEGGGTLLVSTPQSDRFGFGYTGRLDLGVRVGGPVHVHAFGSFLNWPASGNDPQVTDSGQALLLGGGLGVEPELTSRVRLRAEVDLGVSLNGAASDARFTWGLGVGAWFGLADVFDLGPVVRFGSVLASSDESADQGPGSAYFVTFGLAIALHGAEERPAPAPPEPELNRTIAAPPEPVVTPTQTAVAPAAVVAPVVPPAQAVVTPPEPVVTPEPAPPAAPTTQATEEEPEGRRHGHHSRRHGGRHGGSRHGGGHRSGGHGHRRHH